MPNEIDIQGALHLKFKLTLRALCSLGATALALFSRNGFLLLQFKYVSQNTVLKFKSRSHDLE